MQRGGCGARSVPAILPKFGAISRPLNAVKLAHVPIGHMGTWVCCHQGGIPLHPLRGAWCFGYSMGTRQ